ncbi:MAG TPA: hypothetical protein VKH81_24505 [Candidatus Angelobacter sp.]|nr:hypothetical protein [Candidatus Angelobacter sp.]
MKPEERDEEEVRSALRAAFPPVDTELRRDLWPAMLRRMEQPAQKVPWYDWVLAGGLAGATVFFPRLILFFAYHL